MSATAQLVDRQLKRWELERRAALEQAEESTPSPPSIVTVTISRKRGCRGPAIAQHLAERLQYQLFDGEIIDYIATHHKVRQHVIEMLDERVASAIRLWAEGIVAGRHVDRRDFVRFLSKTVRAIHAHGGAVILGRGANCILDGQTAFRVQLTAPIDDRVRQICGDEGADEAQARADVLREDAQREAFILDSFGADWKDPALYDLSINVSALDDDTVTAMIESTMRAAAAVRWPSAIVGRSTAAG